jgi:hypothetical protein
MAALLFATSTIAPVMAAPDLVVFLDADSLEEPYFLAAARYYGAMDVEIVRNVGSIEGLKHALERRAVELGRPLKDVRVVAHATEWTGIAVPIHDVLDGEPDGEGLGATTATDEATLITIDACGLGRRPTMLARLSALLGGVDGSRPRIVGTDGYVTFAATGEPDRLERAYDAEVVPGAVVWTRDGRRPDANYPIRITVTPEDPEAIARLGARRWARVDGALAVKLAELGLMASDLAWREERGQIIGEGRAFVFLRDQ